MLLYICECTQACLVKILGFAYICVKRVHPLKDRLLELLSFNGLVIKMYQFKRWTQMGSQRCEILQ